MTTTTAATCKHLRAGDRCGRPGFAKLGLPVVPGSLTPPQSRCGPDSGCRGFEPAPATPVSAAHDDPPPAATTTPAGPPCRHRGDEVTDRKALVAVGLDPRKTWHECHKPDFARTGKAVTDCRACGLPPDRRCGPASRCPGYSPEGADDPQEPAVPTVYPPAVAAVRPRPTPATPGRPPQRPAPVNLTPPLPTTRVRPGRKGGIRWAYGVTTVPSRKDDLFPRTLRSLSKAGFQEPRLFVDGADCKVGQWYEEVFGLPVTARGPDPVRTAANWFLSLAELYARDPWADRYAVFQDDLVSSLGLRAFLEATTGPQPEGKDVPGVPNRDKVYWNLYTFGPEMRKGRPYQLPPPAGHDPTRPCWYPSNQEGRGAVGLVFTGAGVRDLLSSRHAVDRPLDKDRGHRAVDGGIVTALKKLGYTELVHSPSPLQHTGRASSMGNPVHPTAPSFRGEDWDLTSLLG